MNPRTATREGYAFLLESGISAPQHDAEALLEYVLNLPRVRFYADNTLELTEKELLTYRLVLARRSEGYPLQYIIGTTGFRGVNLFVEPGVFIPRPETEILVDKAIEVLPSGPAHILDLCCGCGNICISLASEYACLTFTAIDNSRNSVRLCDTNARINNVHENINILESDLFNVIDDESSFDVIISNPPYIPNSVMHSLPPEIRNFEPHSALVGGIDGLDIINRIISSAPDYLKHGGWLLLEAGEDQVDKIAGSMKAVGQPSLKPVSCDSNREPVERADRKGKDGDIPVWSNVETYQDLTGRPRVVRARLCSPENGE